MKQGAEKKIAIFHNYLDNIGGAEIVTLTLAQELNADIYTTNIDKEKINKMGFADTNIYSIGKIPLNAPFRQQIASLRFRFLNLTTKYDVYIICGDWAISGAVNHKPNIWYVHSPIREIWDSYEFVRNEVVPFYLRKIFDMWVYVNRYLNKKYVAHVDTIIANSNNVSDRIKKYLHRESEVVYPPIDTMNFYNSQNTNSGYWLSVNRLFSNKRVEMQLDAFAQMPNEKLIIVGSFEKSKHFQEYSNKIRKMCPDNVEIIHWASHKDLTNLYKNCFGFITTAQEEDFGMTVVEAMASGKPVIAPREGDMWKLLDPKTVY
jgi:glycosyltransferase involved in cell wall biosynthesis